MKIYLAKICLLLCVAINIGCADMLNLAVTKNNKTIVPDTHQPSYENQEAKSRLHSATENLSKICQVSEETIICPPEQSLEIFLEHIPAYDGFISAANFAQAKLPLAAKLYDDKNIIFKKLVEQMELNQQILPSILVKDCDLAPKNYSIHAFYNKTENWLPSKRADIRLLSSIAEISKTLDSLMRMALDPIDHSYLCEKLISSEITIGTLHSTFRPPRMMVHEFVSTNGFSDDMMILPGKLDIKELKVLLSTLPNRSEFERVKSLMSDRKNKKIECFSEDIYDLSVNDCISGLSHAIDAVSFVNGLNDDEEIALSKTATSCKKGIFHKKRIILNHSLSAVEMKNSILHYRIHDCN